MKVAVVGSRSLLKQGLCEELTTLGIDLQADLVQDLTMNAYSETQICDFQDIVACELFLLGVDCLIYTGLTWRGVKPAAIQEQILDIGCIVNEALKRNIKIIFVSDALTLGYYPQDRLYDESKLWNQSEEWSYSGSMYHYAEREIFRGITEGVAAVIVRPSLMIGSDSDRTALSDVSSKKINSEKSKGVLSIVSRKDVIALLVRLVGLEVFDHGVVTCSGHSIDELQFFELKPAYATGRGGGNILPNLIALFTRKKALSMDYRPLGLEIQYDNWRSIDWLGVEYSDLEATLSEF